MDDRRGRIAAGYCADLVLLDGDLNVCRTWVAGQPD
jgi:N-acetylglucosamine-6-phosphate deacetylase